VADNQNGIPSLLNDALVLVTGAGQGNGRAIAAGVAAAGARVIVTDIQEDSAEATADGIRATGGTASAYRLDVTDAAACAALAERVEHDIGSASVVVNNAGIIIRETIDSPRARENWHQVLDVGGTAGRACRSGDLSRIVDGVLRQRRDPAG
jgi:NAD(P)-dependent dehydrogenase (short-subunit alcohol dehydrogenase family)